MYIWIYIIIHNEQMMTNKNVCHKLDEFLLLKPPSRMQKQRCFLWQTQRASGKPKINREEIRSSPAAQRGWSGLTD